MFFKNEPGKKSQPGAGEPSARVLPLLPLRDIVVFPHMVSSCSSAATAQSPRSRRP